jgi:CarboxypepD_reg-like domain
LIVCSAGVWWLKNSHPAKTAEFAVAVKPAVKAKVAAPVNAVSVNKTNASPLKKMPRKIIHQEKFVKAENAVAEERVNTSADKSTAITQPLRVAPDEIAKANVKDSVRKDTTPLDEMIVMGYTTKKKKDDSKRVADAPKYYEYKSTDTTTRLLQGQVPGVTDNNVNAPRPASGIIVPGRTTTLTLTEVSIINKNYDASKRFINGKVIANDDGLPMPGVTVKVAGTEVGTKTDANGRFNLSVDSSKTTLLIGYAGYQTRKVNANNRDSVKTIALKPGNSSLADVAVTEPLVQNQEDDSLATDAHPNGGWDDFRKYLKKNAVSPDGKTGLVKLSFMVASNGTIYDIKLQKGLSPASNKKAIDLVNNGPVWAGNRNGEPEKINLRVKFVK